MLISIRWKIILTLAVPLVLVNGAILWSDYQTSRRDMLAVLQQRVGERAVSYADRYNVRLGAIAQVARSASVYLGSRRDLSPRTLSLALGGVMRQNLNIEAAVVTLEPQAMVINPVGAALDRLDEISGEAGSGVGLRQPETRTGLRRVLERRAERFEQRAREADTTDSPVALMARRDRDQPLRWRVGRVELGDRPRGPSAEAEEAASPTEVLGHDRALAGSGGWGSVYRPRWLDHEPVAMFTAPVYAEPEADPDADAPDSFDGAAAGASDLGSELVQGVESGTASAGRPAVGGVSVAIRLSRLRGMLGAVGDEVAEFTILDATGRFVSHPEPLMIGTAPIHELARQAGHDELAELSRDILDADGPGVLRVSDLGMLNPRFEAGTAFWLAHAPIPATDWVFVTAIPERQIVSPMLSRLVERATWQALQTLLLVLIAILISLRITRPIERLAQGVQRVERGELDARVRGVTNRDELGLLAEGFNRMTGRLRAQVEALAAQRVAREKVEGELRVARHIQNALLPRTFPPFPHRHEFELHAVNIAARRVAGDFFDFFFIDDHRLIFTIADVSGKGVPAAMLMAVARTIVRNWATAGYPVDRIVERANAMLHEDNPAHMFVTLFIAEYRTDTGELRYVNAGHPPPFLVERDGSVRRFGEVTAPLVGVAPEGTMGRFEQRSAVLQPGQTLFLYTDGVTEARSSGGLMLEESGATRMLAAHAHEPVDTLCDHMVADVKRFQNDDPADDITVLALRRSETRGPDAAAE